MNPFRDWGDVYASPSFTLDDLSMGNALSRLEAVLAMRPENEGQAPEFELMAEPFARPQRLDLVGTFHAVLPGLVVFHAEKESKKETYTWRLVALIRRLKDDPNHCFLVGEFDARYNKDQHLRLQRLVPDEKTVAQLLMGRGYHFGVDLAFNEHHHMHRHVLGIRDLDWERMMTWLDEHLPQT